MSAQPWKIYNAAKKKIGGSLLMTGTAFRLSLVTSASNFADLTLSVYGSLTGEVAAGNGYASGKALASEAWTVGYSAGQMKFDFADPTWTATGGAIANIKAAVIWVSGASALARHMVAFASLTASQFPLAQGNTMTVLVNQYGALTLE